MQKFKNKVVLITGRSQETIVNIQTTQLNIRHLELSDLADFHTYRSNPDVTKYQGFDVMTMEQAETFIKDNSTKHYGKGGEWDNKKL